MPCFSKTDFQMFKIYFAAHYNNYKNNNNNNYYIDIIYYQIQCVVFVIRIFRVFARVHNFHVSF